MSTKRFAFIVTVREVRTYAVSVRAPGLLGALTKIRMRVDTRSDKPIRGFKPVRLLARTITNCRDLK